MHKLKDSIYLHQYYKQQFKLGKIKKKQWLYSYQNIFFSLGKVFLLGVILSGLNALISFSDMLMLIAFATHYANFQALFHTLNFSQEHIKLLSQEYNLPFYDVKSLVRSAVALISGLWGFIQALPIILFTGFGVKYGQYTTKNNFADINKLCKLTFVCSFYLIIIGIFVGLILIYFWIPNELNMNKVSVHNAQIQILWTKYEKLSASYIISFAQIFMLVRLAGLLPFTVTMYLNKILLLEGALTKNVTVDILMIVANILFDFLLVYFTKLGLAAVACGTVIARFLQLFLALGFLEFSKKNILKLKDIFHTKIPLKEYKEFFHLAYFGLAMLFNMFGASVYETLSIFFLTFVCARLNISSIYFLSLFGAVLPIVNFFSSAIVGGRPKVSGFFSFSAANKDWQRYKEAYLSLTFYSVLFACATYFILSFACPNEILSAFSVSYNMDAVTLLRMQMCMILSLSLVIPARPAFDNAYRIGIDLTLQVIRRYGFFVLFLILFSFFSNSIWWFFSNVCFSTLLSGIFVYVVSFIFVNFYAEEKKRKLKECFPFSLLNYKNYKISRILKRENFKNH